MDNIQFLTYMLVMAGTTYLVRAIPFAMVSEKIENRFIQSFLYYIPYAVLTAMTIPGIFYAPDHMLSAAVALTVAVIVSLVKPNLLLVAVVACAVCYVVELFM